MTSHELDNLVAENSDRWLADATAICRLADHAGLGEETVHVLDAAALPPEATRSAIAWTAGGLDKPLRPLLKDRRGGPVLVLDVAEIARWRLNFESLEPVTAERLGSLEVRQVALHELAHARAAEAEARALPSGLTISDIAKIAAVDAGQEHRSRSHGLSWVRAYLHLSSRVSTVWPGRWWLDAAVLDVSRYFGGQDCHGLAEALAVEFDPDRPLAAILKEPAPTRFTEEFLDLKESSNGRDFQKTGTSAA